MTARICGACGYVAPETAVWVADALRDRLGSLRHTDAVNISIPGLSEGVIAKIRRVGPHMRVVRRAR